MEKPGELSTNDDEFDVYRKRMMLAYRFRPNPLVCSRYVVFVNLKETSELLESTPELLENIWLVIRFSEIYQTIVTGRLFKIGFQSDIAVVVLIKHLFNRVCF